MFSYLLRLLEPILQRSWSSVGRSGSLQWSNGTLSLFLLAACSCSLLSPTSAFPQESLNWLQLPSRRPSCHPYRSLHIWGRHPSVFIMEMARDRANNGNESSDDNKNGKKRPGKKQARKNKSYATREGANETAVLTPKSTTKSDRDKEYLSRITQLENLVAQQTVAIRKLQRECAELKEATATFAHVMEMLRSAGLETDKLSTQKKEEAPPKSEKINKEESSDAIKGANTSEGSMMEYEYFDDSEIFGEAPSSVIDAADAAGSAILAGLLGGKQKMLVDVRDSELSRDPETLVQFIELAILPVAAGLEGLKSNRNRVKIVFPTVSQLLEYRRTMALAAPEVVALSTLGFDPVEERDNLVVIVAPAPDNEEGLQAMNELLEPPEWKKDERISQPVVVLNHHMVPLSGAAADYEVMYHLRILSVQYMSADSANSLFEQLDNGNTTSNELGNSTSSETNRDDEILEAAMQHAYEAGVNQGQTRAMVIRAYPKPWHVFVDLSPSDADFAVAATFDEEPSIDEVNAAIVECLEGSEREDEIVAQQMQQQLEIDNDILERDSDDKDQENFDSDDDDEEDDEDDFYDVWNEDSI